MIMGFKEWISRRGHVFAFYATADREAAAHAEFLMEGGRSWEIDKKWSVRMDRRHVPNMQDHVHVRLNGRDVSIINRDGTQSHGTTRDSVPNWVVDKIKTRGLIEGVLIEEARGQIVIPPEIIERVHFRARIHDLLEPIAERV